MERRRATSGFNRSQLPYFLVYLSFYRTFVQPYGAAAANQRTCGTVVCTSLIVIVCYCVLANFINQRDLTCVGQRMYTRCIQNNGHYKIAFPG